MSVILYIASLIVVGQFYTEVSENIGQGMLNNFFTGRYHTAKEEERIYMFLDMKSSTTIAERLGHVRYFDMLKAYYSDLSGAIVDHAGEIYQYVGDEIVVTWTLKEGLADNNCIACFFAMKAALAKQEQKYRDRYGQLPGFKAGFHAGKVTTGEIGTLKKAIVFTGDVLNTAARIQSLCNSYQVDLLISESLVKKLYLTTRYEVTALGETVLRGKDEKIALYTVQPKMA